MQKFMHEQNRLWDYEIVRELGKGEFGQVYLVKLKKNGKFYALKKINTANLHEKQKVQAFRQIKALKLITHPQIIQYYDSFMSMDNIYIVTQYAEKGDLSEIQKRIKKEKKFTEDELWNIFQGLILGLKHLHQKNIVHRDIKIQNILQTSSNKLKIGDLGMSKILYGNDLISTRVGTPIYFAPELIQHRMYSFPVDIWALGCVFYFMATLEHPFSKATMQTLGYYVVDREPKPIKGSYSPQLIGFINDMLDKNSETRPNIHEVFKKIKQRKEEKIGNRVSIFNLKQIMSLKSHYFQQSVKETADLGKNNDIKIFKRAHLIRKNPQIEIQVEKEQKIEQKMNRTNSMQRKSNMSMSLPRSNKIIAKSDQKQYQQCFSPLIKTNGFSIGLGSPSKRQQQKYKIVSSHSRYQNSNILSNRQNSNYSLHSSPTRQKLQSPNKRNDIII